ncbi:MAG: epoxyqueuosine reductase [Candidatus Heimdallarchaeota archaeon]|nr:MAG: epoxyqueuosine reductase [Candidatus Heimdallarchaeota archaeon]
MATWQFQSILNKESKFSSHKNVIKSNKESPERFDIVLEGVKHYSRLPITSFRTMRVMPSNIKNIKRSLTTIDQNPVVSKKTITDEQLQAFENYAKSLGISSIGYIKLPRKLIFKDKAVLHENVIILSMEMDRDKIEKAPSSETAYMIMQTYDDLGKTSNRLTTFLRQEGFSVQAGHPLGGLVLYPPLAELAGIGYHGRHGLIITPENGPRVRLTAIYTSIENLPIAQGNPHEWIAHFCQTCGRCIRKCPGFAIQEEPTLHENGLLTHITNEYCFPVFLDYHGCSVCIKECPFSRMEYNKLKTQFDNRTLNPEMI